MRIQWVIMINSKIVIGHMIVWKKDASKEQLFTIQENRSLRRKQVGQKNKFSLEDKLLVLGLVISFAFGACK